MVLYEKLQAPVSENDPAGEAVYRLNGKEIGRVQILTAEPCEKAGFFHYLKKAWNRYRNLCYDKKNGSTETETVWEETKMDKKEVLYEKIRCPGLSNFPG